MKEGDFRPLDMNPFRKEWEKKNSENKDQESSERYSRDEKIYKIKIPGIEQGVVFYSGYSAYFLNDLEKVKLTTERASFDFEEGDEWLQDIESEKDKVRWQSEIDEHIKKNNNKPFEIDFPYGFEDKLRKMNLLDSKEPFGHFYYVPADYSRDVEKYNEHIIEKARKEAAEGFAKIVKDINLN